MLRPVLLSQLPEKKLNVKVILKQYNMPQIKITRPQTKSWGVPKEVLSSYTSSFILNRGYLYSYLMRGAMQVQILKEIKKRSATISHCICELVIPLQVNCMSTLSIFFLGFYRTSGKGHFPCRELFLGRQTGKKANKQLFTARCLCEKYEPNGVDCPTST